LDAIISALKFGEHSGALDRYKTSKKTEADKQAAYKEVMFKSAMWSLEANGKADVAIADHIRNVFFSSNTPDSIKMWLGLLLSRISPEKYKLTNENRKTRLKILNGRQGNEKAWNINGAVAGVIFQSITRQGRGNQCRL
jgi:hypothetical protein